MTRQLFPSEIYYSQDSIRPRFSNGDDIHDVLLSICNGRTKISDIPNIQVARKDNKWFALDNRRLWLFKALENRGKCGKINVVEVSSIPANKFTTKNGGTSVRMRSDRGPDSDDDFMFGGYDSDTFGACYDSDDFDDFF